MDKLKDSPTVFQQEENFDVGPVGACSGGECDYLCKWKKIYIDFVSYVLRVSTCFSIQSG